MVLGRQVQMMPARAKYAIYLALSTILSIRRTKKSPKCPSPGTVNQSQKRKDLGGAIKENRGIFEPNNAWNINIGRFSFQFVSRSMRLIEWLEILIVCNWSQYWSVNSSSGKFSAMPEENSSGIGMPSNHNVFRFLHTYICSQQGNDCAPSTVYVQLKQENSSRLGPPNSTQPLLFSYSDFFDSKSGRPGTNIVNHFLVLVALILQCGRGHYFGRGWDRERERRCTGKNFFGEGRFWERSEVGVAVAKGRRLVDLRVGRG
ncbi:hypothetical protein ACH5RR_032813 [Cinchona calisaya]|uniref:Uncharacterized protein n=1 Tax=Cinchona calisaya TaxID=153742 RepID=A0ABD2YL76_9GENT